MKVNYSNPLNPAARVIHSSDGAVEIRTLRNWLAYTETLDFPMCKKFGIDCHNIRETDALNLALELAYLSGKIHTNEIL